MTSPSRKGFSGSREVGDDEPGFPFSKLVLPRFRDLPSAFPGPALRVSGPGGGV